MVTDTRSARKSKDEARKNKDEAEGCSLNKKVNTRKGSSMISQRKDDVAGVRRSVRETSLSRQKTPSPQSTRKSKRLEKGSQSLTPPVKRKSERLEKYHAPSPMRRSDRGMKKLSSNSSGSKQSAKELNLPDSKRKKEKTLIQVTMESEKAEPDLEAVGMKRKKMNAQAYKALFKRQRVKELVPDGDRELEGQDKSSHICGDNSRGVGSGQDGNEEDASHECSRRIMKKARDEGIDRASDSVLQNPVYSLEGCHAGIENDINVDSSLRENIVDEPCSKYYENSSSIRETFSHSERLPTNCSFTENMDAPELGSSTCLAKSQVPSASLKYENHNLLRTCHLCSKKKRVGYDSPDQELCSCSPMVDEDLGSFSTCKDRSDHGAAVPSESAGKCDCRHLLTEMRADSQLAGNENVCALCNKDGELLCCEGKGCKRCFHLYCLDPPLTDGLPGVWHCPQCVKKKLLFGVHSVSDGIELICDVREVEVSVAKEVRQRQYLVKYHGLAHIHNHWVPEKQLLIENPHLVSDFSEKDQNVTWNAEWMVPHRLLRKRPIQDKIYIASPVDILVCNYEWLVKWRGLSYAHATWELDNASLLSSSLGQNLMEECEIRCQKAKQEVKKCLKESTVKVSELPASPHLNSNYVLKNVNKLRECLFQCQNAVVLDDQERAITVVLFIQSMSEICWPFLIVTTSSSLSQWEAEFARLVPSVDVVVYSGNRDIRKGIRASEFFEDGSHVMLQVLLSSAEAVFEDLDILRSIRWEAVVIDEYQHYGISHDLGQIKTLSTNSRILLVGGQIKHTTSEYLELLSLLESPGDFDKLRGLKSETNDNICKLKDRLSRFVAYGSTSQVSKFLEYWVPVQISNYQLEQYCATLLSNSIPLRSCSRNDPVGALRDILLTLRKCCDHPYLLDSSVQERLIAEQRPAAELLDIGIKASGKLQLLDQILREIKTQGLQVLILFQQLIIGSGGASTGDILDDFLRQRFGPCTYERVDAGVTPSKKQAAVNRFNKKETGQFAFLLENRACSSLIKLSSLDMVIIYDSDWNPANDLKALQKISIGTKVDQIKVFRLYSSFTVEERALVLAKQNLNLDNNLQNFSRTTSNALLSWGVMYLFSKLDEYHANRNSTSDLNFSSGQVLSDEVMKEFQAILSGSCENTDLTSVISEVKLGVGSYSTNGLMLGEAKVQFKDGEEPHVFWRNLLDGKNPQWKHLRGPGPRNRKRVNYFNATPGEPEIEKDDVVKKRRKMVNENVDLAIAEVESEVHQATQVAGSEQGPFTIKACNHSQNFQKDGLSSNNIPNYLSGQSSIHADSSADASDKGIVYTDEQKTLDGFLQGEMTRLCQVLKLSEDVTHTVRRFLEYVIKNHHVNSDSPPIVQAFQISLCWIAASIMKQKIDKKDTLMLAKELLNYQCTEEQANSVYSKMRSLKKMYLQCSETAIDSGRDCLSAEEDISKELSNANEVGSQFSSYKQNLKIEITKNSAAEDHADEQILLKNKLELKGQADVSRIVDKIKKKQEKCEKRMKKLTLKHQEEIQEFHGTWEEKRLKLETDHKLESAFIRSIHGQGSLRMEKLKLLEDNFAKKIEEHNLLKDVQLKDLKAKQSAAMNEESLKAAFYQVKAKALYSELKAVNGSQSLGSQSGYDVLGLQPSTCINATGSGDVFTTSVQHLEHQTPSTSSDIRRNGIAASVTSASEPSDASCETPVLSLVTVNSQNEMGLMSLERSSLAVVEHLNQSKHSTDHGETVNANLPAPAGQVSDEIQSVDLTEFPTELAKTVHNEVVGHVDPVELSDASKTKSDKASKITLPGFSPNQRDGPDEEASCDLDASSQHPEQTIAVPDCCDLLQPQRDNIGQNLVSPELHGLDASAVEDQSASRVETRTSELLETASGLPANADAPVTDEMVTPAPVPSDYEAPGAENSGQLDPVSVDVPLSCNESAAIEDHDRARSSPQTVEPRCREVLSHDSISFRGETLEVPSNQLDLGPLTTIANGQGIESSGVSQNDVAMPQLMNAAERPSQVVPQLGVDAGHHRGPNYQFVHPTHQPSSWNSIPSLLADPLQNELERIRKETEQLEKNQQDMMSQLNSDCEKEIQEIIAQIRKKYEVKLQDTEAEFRLKRNEIDKNQNKVLMNKLLAEAFRSKCQDLRPSGLPNMQQGLMHNLHQLSLPPSTRPSASQPASSHPALQTMGQQQQQQQQLLRPHSVRAVQSVTASHVQQHVQAVQHSAAPLSGTSSRPPVISAITPAGNPRVGGDVRSPAPHLQFRPIVAAASIPTATLPSVSQPRPSQVLPSQPPPEGPPLLPPSTILVSQSRHESTPGLVADTNHRTSSPLPEICSTFRPLEQSDLEMLGDVQCDQTSAVATDVVCLSDDD